MIDYTAMLQGAEGPKAPLAANRQPLCQYRDAADALACHHSDPVKPFLLPAACDGILRGASGMRALNCKPQTTRAVDEIRYNGDPA